VSTIVAGYDGSPSSRAAIAHAITLAAGGRVVVVHAHEAAPEHLSARWREVLDREHLERAREVLDEILLDDNEELGGTRWEGRLEPGDPADALLRVAEEVGAEALVVGSHGYGPLASLLGSVSHELLRRADRPVTVIPIGAVRRDGR
jgi:nucleotide-binding universal stress UspA family protein